MQTSLSPSQIEAIVAPLVPGLQEIAPANLYPKLSLFLELLLRWNARTNLTAIRDPVMIVQRHFAESLFAALHLPTVGTMLDLGSGAGFPGLPIQLLRPELEITLAESQGKKASFLREAIRGLGVHSTVWPHRAEALPEGSHFNIVTLRAVDAMLHAVHVAAGLASHTFCALTGTAGALEIAQAASSFSFSTHPLPASESRLLLIGTRMDGALHDVPRGT